MEREPDLIVVFRKDGSIRTGSDLTTEQLIAVRDTVIPSLLNQTKIKDNQDEFTTYTIPATGGK